jgi:hypothetical protein
MTETQDPQPAEIVDYITQTFPDTDVVSADGATFFSIDPEKHWPNFATLVTTDEHDLAPDLPAAPSRLSERGLYRLNIGIGPSEFKSRLGSAADYDYSAIDVLFPHPVYAAQRWVSIINPTRAMFESEIKPLLDVAYRLVARVKD